MMILAPSHLIWRVPTVKVAAVPRPTTVTAGAGPRWMVITAK
jgi:hypothetical protein